MFVCGGVLKFCFGFGVFSGCFLVRDGCRNYEVLFTHDFTVPHSGKSHLKTSAHMSLVSRLHFSSVRVYSSRKLIIVLYTPFV